jgi:hypothetical protein
LRRGRRLGVGTDFYKVRALKDEDLALIRLIAGLEKLHPSLRENNERFLSYVVTPTLLAREIRSDLKGAEDLLEALDIHNTNVVDQHHTIIEGSCVQLLARSLREDVAWYDEGENRIAFCTFIAAQNLRTRRVKNRVIVRLKTRMGLDISRI